MENITTAESISSFSGTQSFLPHTSYSKLEPFCLWLMNIITEHIPRMCKQMISMVQDEDVWSRSDTAFLSKDNSFESANGVVGTLGSAILIIVLITVFLYVTGHRRIKVRTYKYTFILFQ